MGPTFGVLSFFLQNSIGKNDLTLVLTGIVQISFLLFLPILLRRNPRLSFKSLVSLTEEIFILIYY
jgi:hypothetical protein